MRVLLRRVESFELVLVDGWRSDHNDARVLGSGGRMLDDPLQVFFVLVQGDVLLVIWDACIIGTEEDCLLSICQYLERLALRLTCSP